MFPASVDILRKNKKQKKVITCFFLNIPFLFLPQNKKSKVFQMFSKEIV